MKIEIQNGLSKSTQEIATVKMLPTFVQSTPDGSGDLPWTKCFNIHIFCVPVRHLLVLSNVYFVNERSQTDVNEVIANHGTAKELCIVPVK